MGSYSSSYNASETSYTNAPIAQENVTNPINLVNATGNKIGSDIIGSTITNSNTTLDGGAIARAFDFGFNAVNLVADLTKQNSINLLNASGQAVQASQKIASEAQNSLDKNVNGAANSDLFQNKTLLVLGAVVLVAYFYLRK